MIYFNENEPFAAEWLRKLWPESVVDGRDVHDVEELPRIVRLRAYGNAIVPQIAAVFIRSFMEATA